MRELDVLSDAFVRARGICGLLPVMRRLLELFQDVDPSCEVECDATIEGLEIDLKRARRGLPHG